MTGTANDGFVIHLLRHGPVEQTGLLLGHRDDPPINPDCPVMLERVRNLPIRRVVSSDLRRARLQAHNLAQHLEVPLSLNANWRELDFGAWEGLFPGAIEEQALADFWSDPDASPPPEGERWSVLCARAASGLATIGPDTLVVTHAGTMRAALSVLTGLDHRSGWALDLPYRACLTLRIWPGEALAGQVIGLETGYRE